MFSHLVIILKLNSQHIEDIISHFLHLPLELCKLKKKKKSKKNKKNRYRRTSGIVEYGENDRIKS